MILAGEEWVFSFWWRGFCSEHVGDHQNYFVDGCHVGGVFA